MSNLTCPHCGRPVGVTLRPGPGSAPIRAAWRGKAAFEMTAPWESEPPQLSGGGEYHRQAPARAASLESDVLVPLAQAGATGVVVALAGGVVAIWLRWPWWWPVAGGCLSMATAWLMLLGAHRRLLWIYETVSEAVEAVKEEREPKSEQVLVELYQRTDNQNRVQARRFELPPGVTVRAFRDWARDVAGGRSAARAQWVGPGRPFSRDSYDQFSQAMEKLGILANVPGKGRQVTAGGRHLLARWLSEGGQAGPAGVDLDGPIEGAGNLSFIE